jgi:hypothetical protein
MFDYQSNSRLYSNSKNVAICIARKEDSGEVRKSQRMAMIKLRDAS